MRPMLQGDVRAVIRAIRAAPDDGWTDRCRQIMRGADLADRYVRRYGRLHQSWGDGSVLAAASRFELAPEVPFGMPGSLRAYAILIAVMGRNGDLM